MAISPDQVTVTKVANSEEYLNEMFGEGPNGLPSFLEFLEEMRGIPKDTFSVEQYTTLALSSEMMYYTMFLQQTGMAQRNQAAAQAAEEAAKKNLSGSSIDDLVASAQYLKGQLALVEQEITRASDQSTK